MKVKMEMYTPEMAEEILRTRNTKNRPLKRRTIDLYAKLMRENKWRGDNGVPVKFDWNGVLMDGQQRLSAMVKIGKSYECVVVYDMDPEVFSALDCGVKRSGSDVLYIERDKDSSAVASIIKSVLSATTNTGGDQFRSTNTDVLRMYRTNPGYWDELGLFANSIYQRFGAGIITRSMIGYYLDMFNGKSVIDSRSFWTSVSGGGDGEYSPTRMLHRKLYQDAVNKNIKLTGKSKGILIIKAWNLWRKGKECRVLYVGKDEKIPNFI